MIFPWWCMVYGGRTFHDTSKCLTSLKSRVYHHFISSFTSTNEPVFLPSTGLASIDLSSSWHDKINLMPSLPPSPPRLLFPPSHQRPHFNAHGNKTFRVPFLTYSDSDLQFTLTQCISLRRTHMEITTCALCTLSLGACDTNSWRIVKEVGI